VTWESLVAVVLLGWLIVALAVAIVLGHGISFGAEREAEKRRRDL
jgi:hypothetical protein